LIEVVILALMVIGLSVDLRGVAVRRFLEELPVVGLSPAAISCVFSAGAFEVVTFGILINIAHTRPR
jgi:hypothetical protein